MKFQFKDSYNHNIGIIELSQGDTASRDQDSDITGIVKINVPYSSEAWDVVRSASHFEDDTGGRAKIKILRIQDDRLIVEGMEVNSIV